MNKTEQGETLTLRLPGNAPDPLPEGFTLGGFFYFNNGGAKALGAYIVTLGLLTLLESNNYSEEHFAHPAVKTVIASILEIPTTMTRRTGSVNAALESRISAIANQNVNSKVSPVTSFQSSFQWATIWSSLGVSGEDTGYC